jgi:fatty acid amide hydrolase
VICPASYHCAFRNQEKDDLSSVANYFFIWNVVHYPAGVVPITRVLESEEGYYMDDHNDMITNRIRTTMRGSAGMPIGIQVAAPKWKDEVCLAAMKILDSEIKFEQKLNF